MTKEHTGNEAPPAASPQDQAPGRATVAADDGVGPAGAAVSADPGDTVAQGPSGIDAIAAPSGSLEARPAGEDPLDAGQLAAAGPPRKGPLSFLSGSLTALLLAWLSLGFSQRVLAYYALHPPHYKAPIAQSIGTAVKTLVVGTTFLATFSFAFVGLGLFLVFLRSLRPGGVEDAGGEPTGGDSDPG